MMMMNKALRSSSILMTRQSGRLHFTAASGKGMITIINSNNTLVQQQQRFFTVSRFNSQQKKEEPEEQRSTPTTPEIEAPPEHVFQDTENTFKEPPPSVNIPILMTFWKQYFIRYIIITAVGLGVLYAVYWISDLFSSITFKNVAKWSFWTGLLLGGSLVGGGAFLKQYFTISSRTVYKIALKRAVANEKVVSQLGTPIRPGRFRAYSYEYPDVQGDQHDVPLARRMQFWKPVHMQMMFQIVGSKGKQGMVSCEVSRRPGIWNMLNNNFKFHSLSVDIPDDEDRVIMKGTEAHAKSLHGHDISLK
jgi:hypothetical protein